MRPYQLRIPLPSFDDNIVVDILALEQLKVMPSGGTTHPEVFAELKSVFHLLESLGSARIEGNRTTVEELVDATVRGERDSPEALREIANIEDAMLWIERVFQLEHRADIDHAFLCELHRIVVKNLRTPAEGGEGDVKPGAFRAGDVRITGSSHVPPPGALLPAHIDELVRFINQTVEPSMELLRIAMAHHRFVHIHPFRNGNGRVVRLLTYAMLIRARFRVDAGRLINPTAVFCHDRQAYIQALSAADEGTDSALLEWCSFVIGGLRRELSTVHAMMDASTLIPQILLPTLQEAHRRALISATELKVLNDILTLQVVDASLFKAYYPGRSAASISQVIARYKRRGLIASMPTATSRRYVIRVASPLLLRPLIDVLDRAGYLPVRTGRV